MKEIIYLDTEIMNSLLAQLDQGIVDNYAVEESSATSEASSTSTDLGVQHGFNAGIKFDTGALPGGAASFGFNSGGKENEGQINSVEVTEGQKDLLNKQFHDYSLDILMMKLKNRDLIKDKDIEEGDLIQSEGEFDFYDFSLINKAANAETWKEIMSWQSFGIERDFTNKEAATIYDKLKKGNSLTKKEERIKEEAVQVHKSNMEMKNTTEIMKMLELHSSTTDKLFKDLTFVKTDNLVGLLKKDFLRESTESLSFRGKNTRKAKFLGRVIGVKTELIVGDNLGDFNPHEINRIPNILLDILLGSFNILELNDILISPIAVYYESN